MHRPLFLISAFQLFSLSAFSAPAPLTGTNIKLTNVPVQSTAGSVARMLALDATGLGQSVTPSVLWDAIVLTGPGTDDITGLDTALAGKQPLDSDLTSIAALTTTTYGRSLLTTADVAALKSALSLGTSDITGLDSSLSGKQPLDGDLTSIAALTTTTYGRSLLTHADAAATKTALSLGNVENTALSTWAGSSAITTLGTVTSGTFSGTLGAISGSALTNLNGSNISSGTVALARLPYSAGGLGAPDAGKIATYGSGGELKSSTTFEIYRGDLSGAATLDPSSLTDARIHTLPDADGTYALQEWVAAGYLAETSISDALDNLSTTQGSIAYRDAAGWLPLSPGTAGYVLTTQGAGANPTWSAGGSGSPGGSDTYVQINSGGSFGGVSGLTANTTTGALTQSQTTDATTAVYALTAATSSTASSGNQKWSPFIRQSAKGWGTSGSASQDVSFAFGVQSTQGSTATGSWVLRSSINGGAWTTAVTFGPTGTITTSNTATFGTVSASGNLIIGSDVTLARVSAGVLRLGSSDSSTPVAQSVRVQSVSGVANTAGQHWTFGASQGTGTGDGGDIIFQTAPASTSPGSAQNAREEALRIKASKALCLAGPIETPKTVTASGTTGAQTIDKMAGSVNFAAAATSLVITNNLVTANSIIICTVGTNDATMTSVQAVAGSGTITLYPNAAPTGETRVNFLVTN